MTENTYIHEQSSAETRHTNWLRTHYQTGMGTRSQLIPSFPLPVCHAAHWRQRQSHQWRNQNRGGSQIRSQILTQLQQKIHRQWEFGTCGVVLPQLMWCIC